MKNIKEWNWSQILWRIIQGVLLFILNGASFAWLVMNFYGDGEVQTPLGTIEYSYWDTLDLKYKTLVYCLIALGIFLSLFWIKFLYKNKQEKKKIEVEKEKGDKLEKLADKIIKRSE